MKLPKTDLILQADLAENNWILFGGGGYAKALLEECKRNNINLPELIVSPNIGSGELFGVPVIGEDSFKYCSNTKIVLGSDVFQFEILTKLSLFIPENHIVMYYISPTWVDCNKKYFLQNRSVGKDIFVIALNPKERAEGLLKNFIVYHENLGASVYFIHPMQFASDSELLASQSIYMWNGTRAIFKPIKIRLASLNLSFKYIELGFFPQSEYFYIDNKGINYERSLVSDDLSWVTAKMEKQVPLLRDKFFKDFKAPKQITDYIFVPLQLWQDTNITRHSQFTQGMQEFIDYIENLYIDEKIVFKVHPKDDQAYKSKKGIFSKLDSRALILGAKKVHGINSTVLFEASLAGKVVITEGDCLLKHAANQETVLAAIIATQFYIDDTDFLELI